MLTEPDLASIHSIKGKEYGNLPKQRKVSIKNHPIAAATLVSNSKKLPADVDKIILHHHEGPGDGPFPREVDYSKIPTLARMFIVAHDFIHKVQFGELNEESISSALKEVEQTYSKSMFFKKYFKILSDVITVEELA